MKHPRVPYGRRRGGPFPNRRNQVTTITRSVREGVSTISVPVQRAVSDPRVHAQARRAAWDAALAMRRAQSVGVARALDDRRVAIHLGSARRHLSKAADIASERGRRRQVRRVTLIALGAGVTTGTAWTGWRVYSTSSVRRPAVDPPPTDHPSPAV
jgi:hypothetical protein